MPYKTSCRALALSLGLFLFSIYLLGYRGGFHSIDEVSMFAVTESLVKFGRFDTNQIAWTQWTTSQAEAQGFFGQNGNVYSKKGLALSLAQAPLYWLALHLSQVGILQTVSLLNAGVTAATGLLVFMLLWRMNFAMATAVVTALMYGLATIAFVYAKYLFSEPLAGFLLLLTAYMLVVFRHEGGQRHIVIAGLAAGSAVLTRANNLFLLPIFVAYLFWITRQRIRAAAQGPGNNQHIRLRLSSHNSQFSGHKSSIKIYHLPLVIFIFSVALSGVILIIYNAIRSGNPLQTGYDLTLFSANVPWGLYKLLFSPLRGLFVYSPILLLSLPGWWLLRKSHPAEAWLFAALAGATILLFSAWTSGEGLSWGSRFLVPIVPFFAISLAPIIETARRAPRNKHRLIRFLLSALLLISGTIQILGVTINPWIYLARLQTKFGGEFFLENTAALYDMRYNQITGQLQNWSPANSDLAWWQPWGFDATAFTLGLTTVILSAWVFWQQISATHRLSGTPSRQSARLTMTAWLPLLLTISVTVTLSYLLMARYFRTDRQFGLPDDAYSQALDSVVALADENDQIITVAPYHYHVPMNRFKPKIPIIGFAQQQWPLPATALPVLKDINGPNIWLITIGFPPAAPNNAVERWLTTNDFKANDQWFDDGVRLARFNRARPATTYPVHTILGKEVELVEVRLANLLQAGQILPVEFTWQPLKQPLDDYNLFVQLLDQKGNLVAQHDSPPNGGFTPTSTWQPGQAITARHALALPNDLSGGDYRLIAGLYSPASGARLRTGDHSDFVELGNITIIEALGSTEQRTDRKR